jgi:hypothetical protein
MNIGLIGYGFMGGAHATAIQSLPGVALYALASRTRPSDDGPTRGNLDLKTAPLPDSVKWTPDSGVKSSPTRPSMPLTSACPRICTNRSRWPP